MPQISLGGNDYPSFATVAEADVILAGDVLRAAPWATRDADTKKRGMISAYRMLLQLPWIEAPALDAAEDVVKEVQSMLASDLLAKPKLFADASGSSNIKTAKAGSAQVEFFRPVEGGPMIPTAMWTMLLNAGLVYPGDSSVNDGPIVSGIAGPCRPLRGRYADECGPC